MIAQRQISLPLDVANTTPMADYFVIMSGRNDRQVKAIVDAVEDAIEEAGFSVKGIEEKTVTVGS